MAAASGNRGRVAAIVATVLALAAVACGGTGSPVAGGGGSPASAASAGAVAYSACMRSHGVPNYPDPSHGQRPKGTAQDFGVSDSRFRVAQNACGHLLPGSDTTFAAQLIQCLEFGGGDCPPALVHRALTEGLRFARCMRNDGVPNWPDPTVDSMGRPSFHVTAAGISISSTRSPRMLSRLGHCERQTGAPLLRQE